MIPSGLCKLPTANTIYTLRAFSHFPTAFIHPLPLDLLFLLRCCCSTLAMSYNLAYYIQVTHTVFIAFGEHSAMIDCTSRNEPNMVILVLVVF